MAEWLVEQGIGEDRAIRLEHGAIAAAQVEWPGVLGAGMIADAVLVARAAGAARGVVRFCGGEEALVDGLPAAAAEGAALRVEVTRSAIAERGRLKRAQARPTTQAPCDAPSLARRLAGEGHTVRQVPTFPAGLWDELIAEAREPTIAFAGGALIVCPTPAMTLIDVDGTLPPRELARAAVPAIAGAIARFDIGGAIGIDFPGIADRAGRRAVDEALGLALADRPHERTAMNGFGFVQIIARLERPSLLQRLANDRDGAMARLLLRRAEQVTEPGVLAITAHPDVLRAVGAAWREALARRTGRTVRWEADAALASHAGFAQAVSR